MKKCFRCKLEKPLEQFHKDKHSKDGRYYQCAECSRIIAREQRLRSKERSLSPKKQDLIPL